VGPVQAVEIIAHRHRATGVAGVAITVVAVTSAAAMDRGVGKPLRGAQFGPFAAQRASSHIYRVA
jgi:hypothetical protein